MSYHLYKVYYSYPLNDGSVYRDNGVFSVVTTGVVRAAQLTEERHPSATAYNVVHCGQVDYTDQEPY